MTTTAPYGAWVSAIDAAQVVAKTRSFAEIRRDGDDLYWLEMRPAEGGRQVLMRSSGAETTEVLGPETNARTLVHEYGGAAYLVTDGTVVYSDFSDQRLHRLDPGGVPRPITPEPPRPMSIRYADGVAVGDAVVCIREMHPEQGEAVNELVAVAIDGLAEPAVLVSGPDFVSSPRVSPDGKRLAWLSWDRPNMPWDGTELWVAPLHGRSIGEPLRIAGAADVSVVQPEWGPDGALYSTEASGRILRIEGDTAAVSEFARPGGRPLGIEAAAREARYGALDSLRERGDVLFLGHHRDDQLQPSQGQGARAAAAAESGALYLDSGNAQHNGTRWY